MCHLSNEPSGWSAVPGLMRSKTEVDKQVPAAVGEAGLPGEGDWGGLGTRSPLKYLACR